MKKNILLVHTGGTISMELDTKTGGVMLSAANPLALEIDNIQQFANITEVEAFNLPSPHITPARMLELKELISRLTENNSFDGIVITHGTDTLEETAYFLELSTNFNIPIVLTGAMRSSNEIGSDGVYNLMSAVRVAAADDANDKGVLVVLNDEIHTATNVTKTHSSSVSTFQSPQYGPIGIVTKSAIHFHHAPLSRTYLPVVSINKKVAMFKIYAGMESDLLVSISSLGYDGVVLEGLGQGNVPPYVVGGIRRLLSEGLPVILVSRCFNGIAQDIYAYEGGGKMLKDMGVRFEHGLSGQKARLKLLLELCTK
ncbi:asparaginase [Sporosarcina psychrophila]|uniref:asparaginase n=1 Tax=Sporosarcina psychrophila TaxID=1476 RepID=UPI00078E74F1|nr:asparaginase [Sporosarcina psychrophila]AMQ06892.1 L-asparaginase [Sporosarcina psychrophila]